MKVEGGEEVLDVNPLLAPLQVIVAWVAAILQSCGDRIRIDVGIGW